MAWSYPNFNQELPGARAAHSCDVISGKLFMFGGWNGKRALNDLHVLDTEDMKWYEPETTGRIPACRNNHTTAVVDSKIYVHGGHDGLQWLNDLYLLDTHTMNWVKPVTSGQCPTARACHTMSRVGKKLYLFGGYDGSHCFNDIDVLDIKSSSWTQPYVEGPVPMARNAHTMTVIGTKLCLFGGHSGNKHLKDLHILDTETMAWTEPDIYGSPPKGLRGHTANLIGHKIYLFGGYDGRGRSNDLYILDTESMAWTHPLEVEGSPAGRQRHTACTVMNKCLFIFGGFDGNKWLNDIFVLDVAKLEASEIASETIQNLVCNMKRLVNNHKFSDVIFVVEGRDIHAHKAILVEQSEYFKAMLSGGMIESQKSKIEIKDWSYSSYLQMMEFLYTGSISGFSPAVAAELLGLADAHTLKYLKKLCQNCLKHSVDIENCCDLLILGHRHEAHDLKKFCMAFIVKNYSEVSATIGFEHLEEIPHVLIEVTRLICQKKESN